MKAIDLKCDLCKADITKVCDKKIEGSMMGAFHMVRIKAAARTERANNLARKAELAAISKDPRG